MFKLMDKKIIAILRKLCLFNWPYECVKVIVISYDLVCRIYMDNMAEDGELNSRVFPLADTSRRDYPIEEPVDCTWEMVVPDDHRVNM